MVNNIVRDEIEARRNMYVSMQGGLQNIKEADNKFNEFNREIIKACKKVHGKAYLIGFNGQIIIKQYTNQKIYNFEYGMVTPVVPLDEATISRVGNMGLTEALSVYGRLIDRINECGGSVLVWF